MLAVAIKEFFKVLPSAKSLVASRVEIFQTPSPDTHPFVCRSAKNNGIRGYIKADERFLNPKGTLSFAQDTFFCFYQSEAYFTGNGVKILAPKFALNTQAGLFICTSINKAVSNLSWGESGGVAKIENIEFYAPLKEDGSLDIELMTDFINGLFKLHVKKLEKSFYQLKTELKGVC
ncbi:restriction endonuclease subunit S [Helicobacter cynogastricus]|uniref:restriction endonuclease subunit S n=1 Tax=Helicobacter cynogastricus TaxID=329937 RepID=UPI000CF03FF3|nr:restriction endonuclease subunit S [Helicobacter cynogastricus]